MIAIGHVSKQDDGRYTGLIRTISISAQVEIIPNVNKAADAQFDYRVMTQDIENSATEGNEKQRTRLRILSYLNLEKLVEAEGATWLDKELLGKSQEKLTQTGFGSEVASAFAKRRQWLVTQGLVAVGNTGTFHPHPRMLDQLRQHDLRQASQVLSKELGLPNGQLGEGDRIDGTFSHSVNLASGKYAVIQKSKEFTLVPWGPEMEQFRGKSLYGTAGSQGINWDWNAGRSRGLGIS